MPIIYAGQAGTALSVGRLPDAYDLVQEILAVYLKYQLPITASESVTHDYRCRQFIKDAPTGREPFTGVDFKRTA